MTLSPRILSRVWIVVTVLACGWVIRSGWIRIQRIERISEIGVEPLASDRGSPTGYAGSIRKRIVPERHPASYQWIVQTQQMLARGEWRVRGATYDNAPTGRAVHTASIYRWWLGGLATAFAALSGEPVGMAVERAALFAGPTWHLLVIVVTSMLLARRFGGLAAGLGAAALATLYPLAGAFAPGQPDDFALSCAVALWSVLLVLPSGRVLEIENGDPLVGAAKAARRAAFWGGVIGAAGLWINVRIQVPVLLGLAGGGLAAALLARRAVRRGTPAAPSLPVPWRAWAMGGAATTALAYLLEYFPRHLDVAALRLEVNHPLYALAWWGASEILARTDAWARQEAFVGPSRRNRIMLVAAALAVASVPAAILGHATRGFVAGDPAELRLTPLADGATANSIWDWLSRDGFSWSVLATLAPLLAVCPLAWMLLRRRQRDPAFSTRALLAIGPVVVLLGLSAFRLRAWNVTDALLVALVAAALARPAASARVAWASWLWPVGAMLALVPGAMLILPSRESRISEALTESEAQSLVERDVAYWLARRAGGKPPIFLAPPGFASSLMYYGGLRAVATPYWENFDGFSGAVRIAGASSLAQAESLTRRRELDYIVLPSWDTDLDVYARLGADNPDEALIARLNRWLPPLWLRPVAYKIPVIEGFAGRAISIFAVTDMQEDAMALARLAEYFADMSRLDFAVRVAETLAQKYPADVSGLVARCQVAAALGDGAAFGEALGALVPALGRDEDAELPWDRRVSLAIVLAQGKRADLARAQLQRCLEEVDAALLRPLSSGLLIRMLTLMRRFDLEFPEGDVRDTAHKLVPAELREKLI